MQLLLFLLISYGLTSVLTESNILSKPRKYLSKTKPFYYLRYMYPCSQCVGFWVGLIISILIISPAGLYLNTFLIVGWLCDAFLSSGFNNIVRHITDYLENNVTFR